MDAVLILVGAYLLGAVPFSNVAARLVAGTDLRTVGSGTVSGTGLYRVGGFAPLAVAGVADVGKGAIGPLIAGHDRPALAAAAAGLAVVGHNWSVFLRFAGGRGISPALGALAVGAWPGAVALLAGMVVGRLFSATALGAFVAQLALVPIAGWSDGTDGLMLATAVVVPMLVKRVLGNAPPADRRTAAYFHRLLYDSDEPQGATR